LVITKSPDLSEKTIKAAFSGDHFYSQKKMVNTSANKNNNSAADNQDTDDLISVNNNISPPSKRLDIRLVDDDYDAGDDCSSEMFDDDEYDNKDCNSSTGLSDVLKNITSIHSDTCSDKVSVSTVDNVSNATLEKVMSEASERRLMQVKNIVRNTSNYYRQNQVDDMTLCLLTVDTSTLEVVSKALEGEFLKQKELNGSLTPRRILGYQKYPSTIQFLRLSYDNLNLKVPQFKRNSDLTEDANETIKKILSLMRKESKHLSIALQVAYDIGASISLIVNNWNHYTALFDQYDNAWKYLEDATGKKDRTLKRYERVFRFLDLHPKFLKVDGLTLVSLDSNITKMNQMFQDKEWYNQLSANEKKVYLEENFWKKAR
jgi:hypothetical protein